MLCSEYWFCVFVCVYCVSCVVCRVCVVFDLVEG